MQKTLIDKELKLSTQNILRERQVVLALQFGSSVRGGEHPGSDVDIGIVFARDAYPDVHDIAQIYHDLLCVFQEEFPGKKIDVVFLQDTPLSMQYAALQHGILRYAKNPETYSDYLENTMKYYFDFQPVDQYMQSILASSAVRTSL